MQDLTKRILQECESNDGARWALWPTTVIKDKNAEALHEEGKIIKIWEEHFKDLLNPSGVQGHEIQSQFALSHRDHSVLQDSKF